MFKDMSDADLQAAIETLRGLAANAVEMRKRTGVGGLLRDLDIAVAVKRQRQVAGNWTGK